MQNKPKPRLYFSDPIAVLWMMRYFNLQIETYSIESLSQFVLFAPSDLKLYVAPESESIFEPKEGDLAEFGEMGFYRFNRKGLWDCTTIMGSLNQNIERKKPKITMRDNKQFFMPEVENAK